MVALTEVPTMIEQLMDEVTDGVRRYRRLNGERIETAIDTGTSLIRLNGETSHGDWLPFLKRAGIGERTAQRWMRLASEGMTVDAVQTCGGIKGCLAYMKTRDWAGFKAALGKIADHEARTAEMDETLADLTGERDFLRENTDIDPRRDAMFFELLGKVNDSKESVGVAMRNTQTAKEQANHWEKQAKAAGWTAPARPVGFTAQVDTETEQVSRFDKERLSASDLLKMSR